MAEAGAEFVGRAADLMKVICGPDPPTKVPSYKESHFCPLTDEDRPDQVDSEVIHAEVTEEF